jgi:DNA-binding transcriptional ArsR family regulator
MTAGTVIEALSDPTRRQIVTLLSSGPKRAGELAAEAGMSAPAMSRHLRVLLSAAVITDERLDEDARARVFRLRPESVKTVQAWLDSVLSGLADNGADLCRVRGDEAGKPDEITPQTSTPLSERWPTGAAARSFALFDPTGAGQVHDHENFSAYSTKVLHERKILRDHCGGQLVCGDRRAAHSYRRHRQSLK